MKVQRRMSRLVMVLGLVMVLALSMGGALPAYASVPNNVSVEPSTPVLAVSGVDVSSAPENVPGGWWATVQEDIRQSEYQVTWQEGTRVPGLAAAYQAPNRAQDLRVYLTPDGVRVVRRTSVQPAWVWGYRFESPSEPVLVSPYRVEYRHTGVSVWYENGPSGIVQGFVVEGPPADGEPLTLVGLLTGGLLSERLDDGIDFLHDGVPVVRFGDLQATDAQGQALVSRLEVDGGELGIVVEDEGITYPVTVTARITSPGREVEDRAGVTGLSPTPDWVVESDQADAYFGWSLGTAGDVNGDGYSDAIVGARLYDNGQADAGRAYVYYGSAQGLSATADWMAEGDQAEAHFGSRVSTAGDVNGDGYADVIIGARDYDNGQTDEGRAYVYHGSPSGLSATADWMDEGNQAGAWFGRSVGTAGDVNDDGYDDVIVGAPKYDHGQTVEGRAYVYHGSAAGLSATPDWMDESDQAYARFGNSVGTAGDVNGDGYADVIIGARNYSGGQTFEGAAFVYHGSGSGLSATADWMVESDQAYARFGWSVGTSGDVNGDGYADVVVGALYYDNGELDEGGAFAFYGSAAGLSASPDWSIEGDQVDATLGMAVGTAGDVNGDGYADVIVGAPFYVEPEGETAARQAEGWAQVHHGSASGLNPMPDWVAEGDQADALFGKAVGTTGDVNGDGYADVIVGAPWYDNGQADEGRVYVYHGAATGLSPDAGWMAESDQSDARFGVSASTAGDVNGDGYADVIIGAHHYDNGETDEGRAFVYHGSAVGLGLTPDWTAEGNQANALFARSVGTAGDVNGDGYMDVIVGAYRYDDGETDEGAAFVYHGSPLGLSADPSWMAEGDQVDAQFGWFVSTAGDVDGDGYADIVVGAIKYDDAGSVFVYHGSAAGLGDTADWMVVGDQAGALFGYSTGTAGDVNGDGYADVIVGARDYDGVQADEGRAYVYHGSAAGLNTSPDWMASGEEANDQFGRFVNTAGDVNGDGYADVIVGAVGYNVGGAAFVYHGAATGLSLDVDWIAESSQAGASFGYPVGTAGDVNGDGYADVAVGAPLYNGGQVDEGRAFVYHGTAAGLNTSPDWMAESDQADARFGQSVGTAGDVNGDGYADVIVGAHLYNNGQSNEGGAFLYHGNDGVGLDLLPRQMRTDGLAPVAPWGMSDSPTAIQLRMTGRMPLGREDVKLQWQVAPLGTPFTATTIISGTSAGWTDVLTTGVVIIQDVDGLAPRMPHHWRARLLYRPGNRLGQSAGRWVHIPWNGWSELDFRTPEEPIAGLVAVNDSPTVLGEITTLTATVTAGSNVSYTWALGDGASGSGAVVPHIYPAIGEYTVVVTASNSVSELTATTVVTITDVPIAGLVAMNDSPTVLGEVTTLTATVTAGSNVSYTWALGDGASGSGAVVPHIYPAIGEYTAVVTASNSVSELTATTVVTITDVPIAGLVVVNDSPTVLGEVTTLTATVTAGSNVSYTWALGDGESGGGAVVPHTYPAIGEYTAVVTASNSVSELTATTVVTITEPRISFYLPFVIKIP